MDELSQKSKLYLDSSFVLMLKISIIYKMRQSSFGLCAVVLWLSAVWHTSANTALNCPTPVIENGFYASEGNVFAHDTQLHYTCNEGYKPVLDDWWATVTCQNGQWSSEPQCIDETACFDPDIPNANYKHAQFTKNEARLRIRCNDGYEDKNKSAIALCKNGEWVKLPVCQKSEFWCGPPPRIPNALIINSAYQEMFPVDAEVQYICRDGFEPEAHYTTTYCSSGRWEDLPSCRSSGSDDGNNGPILHNITIIDHCGTPPTIANGDFLLDVNSNMYVTYRCNLYYKLQGNSRVMCYGNGTWTTLPECIVDYCELDTARYVDLKNTGVVFIKSGNQVTLGCYSSDWKTARAHCTNGQLKVTRCSSGSDDGNNGPIITTIDHCGTPPTIANGDVLHKNRIFLTYQCNLYYKLQGNSRVKCYGNGTWTTLPQCIVDYCKLDTARDTTRYEHLKDAGVVFIKSGNQVKLGCHSSSWKTAHAHCTNRQLKVTECCFGISHKVGNCGFVKI